MIHDNCETAQTVKSKFKLNVLCELWRALCISIDLIDRFFTENNNEECCVHRLVIILCAFKRLCNRKHIVMSLSNNLVIRLHIGSYTKYNVYCCIGINTLIRVMSRMPSEAELPSHIHHYERLEFLGDAVVEFVTR